MDNKPRYSSTLLRFISSFDIEANNYLLLNTLDKEASFVSRFYTPELKVSELASHVLKDIESEKILPTNIPPNKGSFLEKVSTNNMRNNDKNLYQLARVIMLECFSCLYLLEEKREYTQYLNVQDFKRARANIKYMLDAIVVKEEYLDLVEHLQDFDIHLGYIQAQIPVLQEEAKNGQI